jgi:hypothetical protein
MTTRPSLEKPRGPLFWAGVVGLAVVLFWLGSYWYITTQYESDEWGKIGDLFGAINALFSGLALAGVVYAILLQRQDLKLQQEQLQLSNMEFQRQNQLITEQLKTMQQALDFERKKAQESSEPFFQWQMGHSNSNMRAWRFKNTGGRFKVKEVKTSPPLNSKMDPNKGTTIDSGQEGQIDFSTGSSTGMPESFDFAIVCEGTSGTVWEKKFHFERGQASPVQL